MSNSIFDKLSFGSTSSTVTAFKNLVEDKIDSTTKNVTSTLASTVDNITNTGKNIINSTTSTINNTTNNIINSATSTINNTTNNIINSATSTANSIKDSLNDEYKKFKQTAESVVTEFDFDLYAKALKLPECQNVSFNYVEGLASNLIGTFTGNKTYKDFNGNIESSINSTVSQLSGSISQLGNNISSQINNVTSQISGASSQITGAVTQLGNKFSGQLSGALSQVGSQIGKVILDPSSPGYAIFTNNNITEIISIDDFNPESLIDDFSDLYQTLLNNKFSKLENYTSDIKSLGSLFTSFSEFTSDDIIGTISDQFNTFTGDLVDNVSGLWDSASTDIFSSIDSFKNLVIPDTINSTQTNLSIPDSANKLISTIQSSDNSTNHGNISDIAKGISDLTGKTTKTTTNNINPIKLDPDGDDWVDPNRGKYKYIYHSIYDAIDVAQVQATITYDGLEKQFLCWQQPESISYSASAQFDGIPSRGTQQPFQFYNCANQITLSFELKWHIDELELYKSQYKTLQEIADIAEDFTRPFSSGDSLMPKLCTVTLPSLSEIGYITEAQISYGGAMTGNDPYNYAAHEEMKDNENLIQRVSDNDLNKIKDNLHRVNNTRTDYQYSTLTINFQLLLVKDIKLTPTAKDVEKAADAETARNASLNAAKTGDMSYVKNLDFDKNQSVLPEEPKSTTQIASTAQTAYEATISSQPVYANAQAQASLFYSSEAFAGYSPSSNMSSQ